MQGQLTLGVLTAFVLYLRQFFEPMQDLSQFYNDVPGRRRGAREARRGHRGDARLCPSRRRRCSIGDVKGAVAFEHVTFAYRDKPVLHDIDLQIPAGQIVAVVGETGAGKTTIAR